MIRRLNYLDHRIMKIVQLIMWSNYKNLNAKEKKMVVDIRDQLQFKHKGTEKQLKLVSKIYQEKVSTWKTPQLAETIFKGVLTLKLPKAEQT